MQSDMNKNKPNSLQETSPEPKKDTPEARLVYFYSCVFFFGLFQTTSYNFRYCITWELMYVQLRDAYLRVLATCDDTNSVWSKNTCKKVEP